MNSLGVNCVIVSANVGDVGCIEPYVPKTLTFVWTNVGVICEHLVYTVRSESCRAIRLR
jgi:hypothetical protein